jgi:hypothetical protein
MPASNYLEQKLLAHSLGKTSFTMPTKVYIGLWTTKPTKETLGTDSGEANYTGYKREEVNSAELEEVAGGAATASKVLNKLAQKLALESSGAGVKIKSWIITDNATRITGNALYYGDFSPEYEINTTVTTHEIEAKKLEITAE